MNKPTTPKKTKFSGKWKSCTTPDEAHICLATGVIMTSTEARKIGKKWDDQTRMELVEVFVEVFCKRIAIGIGSGDVIENLVIWLFQHPMGPHIDHLLVKLVQEDVTGNRACQFSDIVIGLEYQEHSHSEEHFAYSIALLCELGLYLMQAHQSETLDVHQTSIRKESVKHVTTHLISASNQSHMSIRLSLWHYFSKAVGLHYSQQDLDRIMCRFGHTIIDYVFMRLFDKKSENISLTFLLENLPLALNGSAESQAILHESLKSHLLKQTDRFVLFLQQFTDHITVKFHSQREIGETWLKHLVALFQIAIELNHRHLARDLILIMYKTRQEIYFEPIIKLLEKIHMKPIYQEMLTKLKDAESLQKLESKIHNFKAPKRGRKPSFSNPSQIHSLGQVALLGGLDIPKAG
ncbi:MAG: hypothetical protein OXT67_12970 [Zetaproteobacteria bacterium]|nr:hypothetical protein [Zetaproteobacteria bacterium]